MKSRQGCFSILTEIANVLPGSLGEHIDALIPGKVFVLCLGHLIAQKMPSPFPRNCEILEFQIFGDSKFWRVKGWN